MKRNLQNRYLRLIMGKDHVQKVEKFVELICDDYNIYDEYYANIIAANTLLVECICELSKNENVRVDIRFIADIKGLRFEFHLGELFLDFAKYFEIAANQEFNENEPLHENVHKLIVIKLLCDEFNFDQEEGMIQLCFRISGIKDTLANQRIELLSKYFKTIGIEIRP
jgi:hypothetical protein